MRKISIYTGNSKIHKPTLVTVKKKPSILHNRWFLVVNNGDNFISSIRSRYVDLNEVLEQRFIELMRYIQLGI